MILWRAGLRIEIESINRSNSGRMAVQTTQGRTVRRIGVMRAMEQPAPPPTKPRSRQLGPAELAGYFFDQEDGREPIRSVVASDDSGRPFLSPTFRSDAPRPSLPALAQAWDKLGRSIDGRLESKIDGGRSKKDMGQQQVGRRGDDLQADRPLLSPAGRRHLGVGTTSPRRARKGRRARILASRVGRDRSNKPIRPKWSSAESLTDPSPFDMTPTTQAIRVSCGRGGLHLWRALT